MPRPSTSARTSRSALLIEPSSWEGLSRYAALRLVADSLPVRRSASTSYEGSVSPRASKRLSPCCDLAHGFHFPLASKLPNAVLRCEHSFTGQSAVATP